MRKYRGIACENKKKYTLFLTAEGEFLRGIPIGKEPKIGEEADFHLVIPSSLSKRKVKPRFVRAAMVAALFLFFIFASMFPMNDKVMAYVQLEGDTAVELGINRSGEVVTLHYLTEPSPKLEARLVKWKGHPIGKVMETTIQEISNGNNGKKVTLTTIFLDSSNHSNIKSVVSNAIRDVQRASDNFTWDVTESTAEERSLANQRNMSIHEYKKSNQVKPANEKKPSQQSEHDKFQQEKAPSESSGKPNDRKKTPKGSSENNNSKRQDNPSKNESNQMNRHDDTNKPEPTDQNKANPNANKNKSNPSSENDKKHPNKQKQGKSENQQDRRNNEPPGKSEE